jgi:hypothetical protein
MSHISSTDTLRSVYFAYCHSILKYGIIFGHNSPNSEMIFTLQKGTVRIIIKSRNSCRNLFMRLVCEYIFTLVNFVENNKKKKRLFQTNSAVRSVNTRNRDHLHRPIANLSCFQKSAHCASIKFFNSLPLNLRSLMNKKVKFKVAVKRCLNTQSFYSVEEFLTFKK